MHVYLPCQCVLQIVPDITLNSAIFAPLHLFNVESGEAVRPKFWKGFFHTNLSLTNILERGGERGDVFNKWYRNNKNELNVWIKVLSLIVAAFRMFQ